MVFHVSRDIFESAKKGNGIFLISDLFIQKCFIGKAVFFECAGEYLEKELTDLERTEKNTLLFFECSVGLLLDFTTLQGQHTFE